MSDPGRRAEDQARDEPARALRTGPAARTLERFAAAPVHVVALALSLATLVLAGQPLYANDTWIHLALGEAFLHGGPWLASDPHLFAAAGPPSTSSWLGSTALYAAWSLVGFGGLRIGHVLLVAVILGLAWWIMRRAGARPSVASAGIVGFILLSTYRVVQLRPDLFTLAATFTLYLLVLAPQVGPTRRRIAAAGVLTAVWSNLHAAFVLGPLLTLGAAAAVAFAAWLPGAAAVRAIEVLRARRLALAGVVVLVCGGLNPSGFGAYLPYFSAGEETLALGAVIDEWGPTRLFAWPIPTIPPTLAAWLVNWLCVVGVGGALLGAAHERLRPACARPPIVDPALLALAVAGLAAGVIASRFLWLDLFALALLGALLPPMRSRFASIVAPVLLAAGTLGAAALHLVAGDWPLVSRALRAENADYRSPYPTERYNAHAVWFLADTGVEGRVFNDYPLGGFMSFWLAPKLQMASSGTMNVARDAMEANFAIGARQRQRPDEDYAALLDRMGVDLFVGLGFPIEATPGRPIPCTIRHLEHEPGWLLVFRNLRNAVYLRLDDDNRENLARIAAYYAHAGVPFEQERGFEVERVVSAARDWAIAHGMVPVDYGPLLEAVEAARRSGRADANVERLALIEAALGLYEEAYELDRFLARSRPDDPYPAWRMIWSLVQQDRWNDALAEATAFERRHARLRPGQPNPLQGPISGLRRADASVRPTLRAHLPMMRADQIDWLRQGVALAPPRWTRPREAP